MAIDWDYERSRCWLPSPEEALTDDPRITVLTQQLTAIQQDADSHLERANQEIVRRERTQIAYTRAEQKRLTLTDKLEAAEAQLAAVSRERDERVNRAEKE
mgnify:CR=1 FL=1